MGKNIHKIAMNEEVGDTGRYNFGQKCVFWAAIGSLLLLLASGIVIWRPYFADAFSIPVIRLALMVHSFAASAADYCYYGTYLCGTVGERYDHRDGRRLGTCCMGQKHHPRWYREVKAKEQERK